MTRLRLILLAMSGSVLLLAGAFAFQYIGGMAPCELCLAQRWPHGAAILIGLVACLRMRDRFWPWLGGLAALTTAGIALYHTGVERHWWEGPTRCTGSGAGLGGLSGADLLDPAQAGPIVMCDQVAWAMWGLSMASWNGIASLVLVAVWVQAARR